MLKQLKISILSLIGFTMLVGGVYPLAVTGIAQWVWPRQANGSLIHEEGQILGSSLIGQSFEDPKYFWGRLSATAPAYNGGASSGSNFGLLNPALLQAVQGRIDALRKSDPQNAALIPVDLVTASGSGLDPHISPAAALYQLARVSRARGLSEETVARLVNDHTLPRWLGLIGEPAVNVLRLNIALNKTKNNVRSDGRPAGS